MLFQGWTSCTSEWLMVTSHVTGQALLSKNKPVPSALSRHHLPIWSFCRIPLCSRLLTLNSKAPPPPPIPGIIAPLFVRRIPVPLPAHLIPFGLFRCSDYTLGHHANFRPMRKAKRIPVWQEVSSCRFQTNSCLTHNSAGGVKPNAEIVLSRDQNAALDTHTAHVHLIVCETL